MSESFDSILSNDEAPADETETVETPESGAAGETPAKADAATAGEPDANESETDEIDAEEPDDLGDLRYSGLKKAARKERKFRQAAEKQAKELQRQLDQLSGQLQQMRQQPQPKQEPATAPAKTEPEPGFFELGPEPYVQSKAEAAAAKVREHLEKRLAQLEASQTRNQLDSAEVAFCSRVADGKEHIDHFAALCRETDANGRLTAHAQYADAQLRAVIEGRHPQYRDPSQFAYDYAKAARQAVAMSDPNYEAQLRAKWEAEQRGDQDTPATQARPQHKTIAAARGSSGSVRRASADPDSMSEILA